MCIHVLTLTSHCVYVVSSSPGLSSSGLLLILVLGLLILVRGYLAWVRRKLVLITLNHVLIVTQTPVCVTVVSRGPELSSWRLLLILIGKLLIVVLVFQRSLAWAPGNLALVALNHVLVLLNHVLILLILVGVQRILVGVQLILVEV